jgi:hypothetical protein
MILILPILCRTSFLKCTKWSTRAFWTLDASASNVVNDITIGVDKGGVAMCFHPKRWNHVIDQDRLTCNRFQWMRFKAIEGGAIGNLDLYVCNMTSEQCEIPNKKGDQPWNQAPQSYAHVKAKIRFPWLTKLRFETNAFERVWPPHESVSNPHQCFSPTTPKPNQTMPFAKFCNFS